MTDQRTQEPIPLDKRQPTEADCDSDQKCWWWIVDDPGQYPYWIYAPIEASSWAAYTHWLPYWALPVPMGKRTIND